MLGGLAWAIGLASVLGLATGSNRAISLEIWLIGFTCWLAAVMVAHLLQTMPFTPARLIGIMARPKARLQVADGRPLGLRSLEGLLIRSRDQARTHHLQLRPHLRDLADHHLPRRHGIDQRREPERATALLGDVAWLIDPSVTDQAPTLSEIETFFDRLIPPDNATPAPRTPDFNERSISR